MLSSAKLSMKTSFITSRHIFFLCVSVPRITAAAFDEPFVWGLRRFQQHFSHPM